MYKRIWQHAIPERKNNILSCYSSEQQKKSQQPAMLKHLFCKREGEKGSETLNRQRKAVMCCSSSNLKERT